MNISKLVSELKKTVLPIVTTLDYELYHIEIVKEEGEYYLRIYINKDGGITLEDCEKVSRAVSDMLDETDPIPFGYYLEVSSPGLNRALYKDEHIETAKGHIVLVKLLSIHNGKKQYRGTLIDHDGINVILNDNGSEVTIPKEKISSINLDDEI